MCWVPEPPTGTYTIRAEYWRSEYKNGYWKPVELIATDQVSFRLIHEHETTPAWTPEPTTNPPIVTNIPTEIPSIAPNVGAIYVYSSPGNAEIWINGKYTVNSMYDSNSPFGFTDLLPGTYTVTLRKPGYKDFTEVVNLHANEIYDIRAVLEEGVTPTGWIVINSNPEGVDVYLNERKITIAPTTITDVQPGVYRIRLKKSGFDDWYDDSVAVSAGQITTIDATLPLSGGFPVGGVVGGAAAAAVLGGGIALLRGRGKGAAVKNAPPDLYQQWWNNATPDQRKDWQNFDNFLNSRFGSPYLNNYQDSYGRPSWSSAYTSWQKEVKSGSKESFEEWVNRHSANQQISREMWARAEANKDFRPKDIVDATNNYAEAVRNRERFQRLTTLKKAVASDKRLSEFADNASNIIMKDGIVDAKGLARLEGNLKYWIVRDKMMPQTPDYTYEDALWDTLDRSSKNIVVRAGAAYLTGGYSEMALNPISSITTMRSSIMQGDSTTWAVTKGFMQSGFELALGESGRLAKYAKPYLGSLKESRNLSQLSKINQNLSSEISTINQLAKQTPGQTTRNAFMKSTEVARMGQTQSYTLNNLEKQALKLNNNPEFRKLMAENSDLIPANVKEVMGVAKQKAYEQARNNAIDDVMNQMAKDGINTAEKPFFIRQTGTHAQPGNPGWNSVKSDFDHTVDFGTSKYNQLYEQRFNSHLQSQGTSAQALDANVYQGTTGPGAYEGGALKFVQHYNETSGSDIMIRNVKGMTTITRETPQASTSLLSRMNASDVKSAHANYQKFFVKDISKGTTLDSQIVNGAKTVSRDAGQYSAKYVEHFQQTGRVNYQPPPAARVADLIKKQGYTIDEAIKKVGYTGNKEQLLRDFKAIMGM